MAGSFRDISTDKDHDFRPYLGFAKNVKEISGPSLKILPDYYCLLAFECQDSRFEEKHCNHGMNCTSFAHFTII